MGLNKAPKYQFKSLWITTILLLFVAVMLPIDIFAAPVLPDTPASPLPQFNSRVVNNIAASDGTMYMSGDFKSVDATRSIGAFLYDENTGQPSQSSISFNGGVRTAVPDGAGGWYVGGEFTAGISTRNRLAHVLPDGSLNPNFNPDINGSVLSVVLSPDASTLYVSGDFTTVNGGTTRNRLAAFDTSTGTATSFNPNLSSYARSILLSNDGSTLYAGGNFTTVNGSTARTRIAAFDTATGTATSFNPIANNQVYSMRLSTDESILYAAGDFTTVNSPSTTRNRLAAFDTSTGTATSFNPNLNDFARSVLLSADGSTLYVGGNFTTVNGGTTRNRLAAFDTSTGTATSFNPNLNAGTVFSLSFGQDESTVFVGGSFVMVNDTVQRNRFAEFNATTGTVTDMNVSTDGEVMSLSYDSLTGTFYVGGYMGGYGGVHNNLVRILPDGSVDASFNPTFNNSVWGLALSPDESMLYVSGHFTGVNGQVRLRMAALNTSDGSLTDFNPELNAIALGIELSPDGQTLYAHGSFTTVNGSTTRNRLAAFDVNTSLATSFNPDTNNTVWGMDISPDGQTLYAGGAFTTVNGSTTRNRLAAFDTSTGTATSFNPNLNNETRDILLTADGDLLYITGVFTTVNGSISRSRLAAFDTATGLATSFNPNINDYTETLTLTSDETVLYVGGGGMSMVNGSVPRNRLAAFDTATGIVTDFNPVIQNVAGWNMDNLLFSPSNNALYVSGNLFEIDDQSFNFTCFGNCFPGNPAPPNPLIPGGDGLAPTGFNRRLVQAVALIVSGVALLYVVRRTYLRLHKH